MDPKKKKIPTNKKKSTKVDALRQQLAQLRSNWMRSEEDRIQLSVRHMDLLSQQSSISATYVSAVRERDKTLQQLLLGEQSTTTEKVDLSNEGELRRVYLSTADKAVQTELW